MKYLLETNQSNQEDETQYLDKLKKISRQVQLSKAQLDHYHGAWRIAKRMVHPYEYVYSSPCKSKNICDYLPISRSYFKMKEIYQLFLTKYSIQRSFCLAEAPGGFVEALLETSVPIIYGSSLISSDKDVPDWSHKLHDNERFHEILGSFQNGDLLSFDNVISIIYQMKRDSCDLITGDGGFDTSDDYNSQEVRSYPLIYSEIYIALHLQKLGGCFVCKLFDTFDKKTLSLLYLLSKSYRNVSLYKPSMSRISNSEKYVICEDFRGAPIDDLNLLTHHFQTHDLEIPLPPSFLRSMLEPVESFSNHQIKSIQKGISYIKKNQLSRKPSSSQIIQGKKWCLDYDTPLNGNCMFL